MTASSIETDCISPTPQATTASNEAGGSRASPTVDADIGFDDVDRRGAERRVLVIASRFPPVASVGATRARKFVKYLGQFGWKPVVITGAARRGVTCTEDARRATDYDSLGDVPPNVPVHRISPIPDNWHGFAARTCSARLGRLTRRLGLDEAWWHSALKWRLQRVHDRFAFPDRGIWRAPSAIRLAFRLHRRYRFDAIFSTGMPFSDHLIGLALHRLLRRPWLAEFRDPWFEYVHWQQWNGDRGRRLTRAAERAVVRDAARIISVNDRMTERFRMRYGGLSRARFVTIENGFDPADFDAVEPSPPRTCFRLLHAGSLYETRNPAKLLEAFRRFLARTPGSPSHARFDFAGRHGPFVAEFSRPEDHGAIRHLGMLTHRAALKEMASADVNAIFLPNIPGAEGDTTTKMYECLGCGRPILAAVPPQGAAAERLRGFDGVFLCDPDDVEAMTRTIADLYRRWLTGSLPVRRGDDRLASITRRYQTRQLAVLLDSVTGARRTVYRTATLGQRIASSKVNGGS